LQRRNKECRSVHQWFAAGNIGMVDCVGWKAEHTVGNITIEIIIIIIFIACCYF
jgi:hypothetical protein